jgi:hypothetical protein
MMVFIRPLHRDDKLHKALRADGWFVEGAQGEGLMAEHPGVADERAGRHRLHRLGLLTSALVRIEFLSGPGGRPTGG